MNFFLRAADGRRARNGSVPTMMMMMILLHHLLADL
jgi:hypothetical protein